MNQNITNIDLYSILDVLPNSDKNEIKKKYRMLSKKYHPDKGGSEAVFELITTAYNILCNDKMRADYDFKCRQIVENSTNTSYVNLKSKFIDNIYEHGIINKEIDEEKFKKENAELDAKHNFDKNNINNVLEQGEMMKKMKELELSREQDDIELTVNPCDINAFNITKFNSVFLDKNEVVPYVEPISWNLNISHGAKIDKDTYNNIYTEDNFEGDDICSNVHKSHIVIKSSCALKNMLNDDEANDCDKKLSDFIKERDTFDRIIKKM